MTTTPDGDLTKALADCGVDTFSHHSTQPDGSHWIQVDGGRVAAGWEPWENDPDRQWWMATLYDVDDNEILIYEGTDVADLAGEVGKRKL